MELWRVTPLSQDKFLGNYIHKYKFRAEKALWEKWPSFTRGSPLPSKSPSQNISPWRRALTGKTLGAGSAVSSPAFSLLAGPPCALRLWSSQAQELQLSGSVAPRMRESLSTDQGLNPRPLCCKADSTTGTPGNSLHSSLFSVLRPHLLCFPCWEKQLVMMKCHEIKRYGGEENKYKHSRLVNT